MEQLIKKITTAIAKAKLIQVEVSARHVHLSPVDLETLFGKNAVLTPKRPLSQPGQFLSEERVDLVGPRGRKDHVAVLGPVRPQTQIELSLTDCKTLGVKAPVRESGHTEGSGTITLVGPCGCLNLESGVIVAHRHIHLTPEEAGLMELSDNQRIRVQMLSERPIVFENVVVRVRPDFKSRMHIDQDEANAAGVDGFTLGKILVE